MDRMHRVKRRLHGELSRYNKLESQARSLRDDMLLRHALAAEHAVRTAIGFVDEEIDEMRHT